MRIKRILVRNLRGIRHCEFPELEDIVVIAGQNGSGKSCVLDAIRLLKSAYGEYQNNEYQQWFGEFQINVPNHPAAFSSIMNNRDEPLVIEMDVEIHPSERQFLKDNSSSLINGQAWRAVVPELRGWRSVEIASLTAQHRAKEDEVKRVAENDMQLFQSEIERDFIRARIEIGINGAMAFNPSKVLELVWSTYDLATWG